MFVNDWPILTKAISDVVLNCLPSIDPFVTAPNIIGPVAVARLADAATLVPFFTPL